MCIYSALDLSFEGDRFPAIAGIAQKISQATGYTYLAGLWKERLHTGLLWHASSFVARQTSTPQAPSWSWASLGGPIGVIYCRASYTQSSDFDAEVVDASVYLTEEDDDVFAHGESAEITLNASYFNVWCRSSSKGHAPYSDPYLRKFIDIFDGRGIFIGTGYWDRLPDEQVIQSTAVVVSQRVDEALNATPTAPITTFLLVKDKGDYTARTGVGHTGDEMHGRVSTALDLAKCDRKQFLLR